jgi:hypothetical protein
MIIPNIRALEIATTYVCNVRCANCNSLCSQAPASRDLDITTNQIKELVSDSVLIGYPWEWIKLHGGQPTLHPDFFEICEVLADYKRKSNKGVKLAVVSNGHEGDKLKKVEEMGFEGLVSVKVKTNVYQDGTPIPYVTVNASPVDLGMKGTKGCFVPSDCGICFNNLGFWLCSPLGAAARVFGYQSSVKRVADISVERLVNNYYHCDHCGYGISGCPRSVAQVTSKEWADKLKKYNEKD